jgi:hypothetical protein
MSIAFSHPSVPQNVTATINAHSGANLPRKMTVTTTKTAIVSTGQAATPNAATMAIATDANAARAPLALGIRT